MIFAVVLYFTLAATVLALVLLPASRTQALDWAQRMLSSGFAAHRVIAACGQRGTNHVFVALSTRSKLAGRWVAVHGRWIIAASALLIGAPLLPLVLRDRMDLEGYDHRVSREIDPHIAALLQGEQLSPPPPLPAEWLGTRELEKARPLILGASQQWELLDAEFRQRLLIVFKLMRERHGIEMVLLEGYRSPQRQQQLAELGPQTTRADPFESWHQYGLAADCAFVRNGRIVVSGQDAWAAAAYEQYGEAARSVGLTWGGGWRSLKDYGHVELRRPGTMAQRGRTGTPVTVHAH
jgi:peptidoglycan L-alanyl-D-glutamate endopeptidase CwlK